MASLDFTKISVAAFLKTANKGSAKRCLFGPVNHEESRRLLKEQLASQEKESREKWGFDFKTETPVRDGRFNWQKVDSTVDQENLVPQAYALPQMINTPSTTTTKSRVCSPLTFSAKVNMLHKLQEGGCVTSGEKKKWDFAADDFAAKKDVVMAAPRPIVFAATVLDNTSVIKVPVSPAGEREPVTTVPMIKKFRNETPTVQELSSKCTKVSEQITPESAESSTSSSSGGSSSTGRLREKLVLSPSNRSPSKRKLAQSDITEFFQVKKSRNILAVNSAKRRLDL